jgi:hypothetical protein
MEKRAMAKGRERRFGSVTPCGFGRSGAETGSSAGVRIILLEKFR